MVKGKELSNFYIRAAKGSKLAPKDLLVNSSIRINISDYKITLELSFPSTDFIYYKVKGDQLEVSNDLRLLYDADVLNTQGILSLLLLGAAVPPLSPFKGIEALIPGYRYEFCSKTFKIKSRPFTKWSALTTKDKTMDIRDQAKTLTDVLDEQLRVLCPDRNPIILFSGGVDSSVIAHRVSAMGWSESTLFHSSFGKDDKETEIAREINSYLQLNLDIHNWKIEDGFECLEKSASLYTQPFCDHSCVPTHSLSRAVASRYGRDRIILDGTGADGAFGLINKVKQSRQLYGVHRSLRNTVGAFYNFYEMWGKISKIEYYLRILRRSSVLSELSNSIAQSPLVNIAFEAEKYDIEFVDNCCNDWINSVSQTSDNEEKIPLLDIGLVCSGIFAQKNKYPLKSYGIQVEYPYLNHDIVDLALGHARFWPESGTEKNTLKYILASALSPELVYRKKSGFVAPLGEQFSHPIMLEYLHMSTDINSPLYGVVNQRILTQLIQYVSTKKKLPTQTYTFLWGIAFINSWLSQIGDVSSILKKNIHYNVINDGHLLFLY